MFTYIISCLSTTSCKVWAVTFIAILSASPILILPIYFHVSCEFLVRHTRQVFKSFTILGLFYVLRISFSMAKPVVYYPARIIVGLNPISH